MKSLTLVFCLLLTCLPVTYGHAEGLGSTSLATTGVGEREFLPVDEAYQLSLETSKDTTTIIWQIAEGYYLYRHAFKFSAKTGDQPLDIQASIPDGEAKHDDYFGDVQIYHEQVIVSLHNPQSQPYELTVTSQGCADEGLCYPPQKRVFQIEPEAGKVNFAGKTSPSNTTPGNRDTAPGDAVPKPKTPAAESATLGLPVVLAMALLGGLILNLMPCVFPVLTIKILSFSGKDPNSAHLKTHGLVYTAGVMLSFVAVAALMLGLRASGEAVGWGFQLQNPWFVGGLTYLFLIMALSLGGLVEFGGSLMGAGEKLASQGGYSGSFFTGVLAVVVASPCTAPFMGSALGFAITQPAPYALGVFAALGFGMALPFLLISFVPALARLMPRPGPWMDTFKRLLAFPLLATCIWLIWVAGNQTSANGMALLLLGCLAVSLALFLYQLPARHSSWRLGKSLVAVAALASALLTLQSPYLSSSAREHEARSKNWVPYSESTLQELRSQGKAVFLNLTADWCITCLANERVTLSREEVLQAFTDHQITYMKGDWTNYDPAITELLTRYQRSGIPLYVFFPADQTKDPIVLPQVLKPQLVLDTIKR